SSCPRRRPPCASLFPYTTLFRSRRVHQIVGHRFSGAARRHVGTAKAVPYVARLRETEVEHLHPTVVADFDVGRLQIAMDDALLRSEERRVGKEGSYGKRGARQLV